MRTVYMTTLFLMVAPHLECSASPLASPEGAADPQPSPGLSRDLRRFLLIRQLEPREVGGCDESSSEESSCEESSSSSEESSSSSESSSSEETGGRSPCDPWDERCRIALNEDPGFEFYYQL